MNRTGEKTKSQPTMSELHELVEVHLRRIDQRYTPGREAVVTLLASFGRPMSISDISQALPDVPRSSAYRHLSDLQVAGVVRRIAASDEFASSSVRPSLGRWARSGEHQEGRRGGASSP